MDDDVNDVTAFDWGNGEPVSVQFSDAGRGRGRQPSQPVKAPSKPKHESAWSKFNNWEWGEKSWSSYSSTEEQQHQHPFPPSSMGRGKAGPSSHSAQSSNHESRNNSNSDGPGPGRANDNLHYFIDCNGSGGSNGTHSSSHQNEIGSMDDEKWEVDEFDHSKASEASETPASSSSGVKSRSAEFPPEVPYPFAPNANHATTYRLLQEVPPQHQPMTASFHQDLRYGSGPYSQPSPFFQDPRHRPGPSRGDYFQDPRHRPGPSHGDYFQDPRHRPGPSRGDYFQDPRHRPGPLHGDLPSYYFQDPRSVPWPRQNIPPPPGPQPMQYLPHPQVQKPRPQLVPPGAPLARRGGRPGAGPLTRKDRPSVPVQISPSHKAGPGRTNAKNPEVQIPPNPRGMPPPEKPLSPTKPPPVQPGRSILKKKSPQQDPLKPVRPSPPDKPSFQVPKPSVTFSLNDIVQSSTPNKISNASSSSPSPRIAEKRTVTSPAAEAGKGKKRSLSEDKEDSLEDFLSKSKNRVSARTYAKPTKRASSVAPPEENQSEDQDQDSTLPTDPRSESEGAIENKTDATANDIVTNNQNEQVDDDPPLSITIRTDIFAEDDDDE